MKKIITWILLGAIVVISTILIYKGCTINEEDNVLFSKEYTGVKEDNVFVYKTIDEVINLLQSGTGVIYLGFPECPWCQAYVPYVNEVAKENGITEIYYFNIKEDRKNNTLKYQKVVSILSDYLENDDDEKKRVYVPDLTVVKDGKIVGHNNETSYDTLGFDNPSEYWTIEKVNALKDTLKGMFKEISSVCTTCN